MPRTASTDDNRDPLIALRIPPDLDAKLRAHAEQTGSTISHVVRTAIEAQLNGKHKPAAPSLKRSDLHCQHRTRRGAYCRHCKGIV